MSYCPSPSFLTSHPYVSDPSFRNSVIALALHQNDGALGFLISKHTNIFFHELLEDLSIKPVVADRLVLYGGPFAPNSGFLLYEHEKNKPLITGIPLCDTISITPSRELLDTAAAGKLPGRFELILGFYGWGPGELENELNIGGWLNTNFYSEIIFDIPIKERWNRTFSQFGVSPYAFMAVPGGAFA